MLLLKVIRRRKRMLIKVKSLDVQSTIPNSYNIYINLDAISIIRPYYDRGIYVIRLINGDHFYIGENDLAKIEEMNTMELKKRLVIFH